MSSQRRGGDGESQFPVDLEALKKIMGGSLVWVAGALLVLVILLLATVRVGRVTGEDTGILLNKLNGKMTVIKQSGVRIYNGITGEFYTLDKTLQTLDMSGGRGGDGLKVKTVDGSDVHIDLKVQYRIAPDMADTVITSSGPGEAFKEKWARDYARAICRNYLGELTTEQCYDAAKRDSKIALAQKDIVESVGPFGIVIDSIAIPRRPVFYKEYEEMIKKKKLADQGVLEERSKALAAKQKQLTLMVQATNVKNVAIETFKGQMEQKVIQAGAAAVRVKKEADAYHTRVTIEAEAKFYENEKGATGILAKKRAEAEGIEELKKALEGEGGRNMVKLEYAKKLKGLRISGQPFVIQGRTDMTVDDDTSAARFQHIPAPASVARPPEKR